MDSSKVGGEGADNTFHSSQHSADQQIVHLPQVPSQEVLGGVGSLSLLERRERDKRMPKHTNHLPLKVLLCSLTST